MKPWVFWCPLFPCFLPLTSTCIAPETRFFGSNARDHHGTKMKQAVFVRHKRERNVYHVVWFEQGRERTRSYPTRQEAEQEKQRRLDLLAQKATHPNGLTCCLPTRSANSLPSTNAPGKKGTNSGTWLGYTRDSLRSRRSRGSRLGRL